MSSSSSTGAEEAPEFVEYKESFLTALPSLLDGLGARAENFEYLGKGSYNIVFSFDLLRDEEHDETNTEKISTTPCIIRISHVMKDDEEEDAEEVFAKEIADACKWTRDQAAILTIVHQHIPMTPELLYADPTTDNIIARPYNIQTRLEGQTLVDIWDELEISEKKEVIEQLADFFVKAESVQFPSYGQLSAASSSDPHHVELGVSRFANSTPIALSALTHHHLTIEQQCRMLHYIQSPKARADLCEDYIARQANAWRGVGTILRQISEMPSLHKLRSANINDAVLKHNDLHMGNIMVSRKSNGIGIGIIDWDNAQAMPRVLARTPPSFLWQAHLDRDPRAFLEWDGHPDHIPRELRDFVDEPEGGEIKAHFEQCMQRKMDTAFGEGAGQQWLNDTYGDATWLRRVVELCFDGIDSAFCRVAAAERLVGEWAEKREADIWTLTASVGWYTLVIPTWLRYWIGQTIFLGYSACVAFAKQLAGFKGISANAARWL